MSPLPSTTSSPEHASAVRPSTRRLVERGALGGAIAAVATTVVAAIASAAGVDLEVEGTAIPIPAFAVWTIVAAAIGIVLARLLRERRRFVVVTTVATGLSLIPAITAPDDTATRVVLVAAHLVAAAVIIPMLGQQLTRGAVAQPPMRRASRRDAGR
jgi:hypothetical protein